MLRGLITAIVTPMKESGEIDFLSLDKLVEYQITNGASGLVVLGSTGESATLSDIEREMVIARVIKTNANRSKIIVGVGIASTVDAVTYVNKLNQISGIDYIMAVTPYYLKPTQQGLHEHFSTIAKTSNKPVILYNVPSRTGCDLMEDTTIKLANEISNIVGLKDSTGNIARACYLIKNKPSDFMLFSGDDATALAFMLCGGDGVISVLGNLLPKQMSELSKYAVAGDKQNAVIINNKILSLYDAMGMESNPIPVKWSLYYKNIIDSPVLRLPLTTLSKTYQEQLSVMIDNITSC